MSKRGSLARRSNPPGRPVIDYRLGDHGAFKRAMLAALGATPGVAGLTTRDDDDPTIALVDAWASVLDNLAFYQERTAIEGYLRTAVERRSVLELARAIGYELRPGVAATTHLSFDVVAAPGAIDTFMMPLGTRAQSVPAPGELPHAFETVEPLEARPAWNAIPIVCSAVQPLQPGDPDLLLVGTDLVLADGDPLLVLAAGASPWFDVRRVRATRVEQAVLAAPTDPVPLVAAHTVVTLDAPLVAQTATPNPAAALPAATVFVFRQRVSLFGYNAPPWNALPVSLRVGDLDPEWLGGGGDGLTFGNVAVRAGDGTGRFAHLDDLRGLTGAVSHVLHGAYRDRQSSWADSELPATSTIDLDQVYPRVINGSRVVIERDGHAASVRTVTAVREVPRADYGVAARVTRLTLSAAVTGLSPRATTVLVQSDELPLAAGPLAGALAATDRIDLDRDVPSLAVGRTVVVSGESADGVETAETAVIAGIETGSGAGPRLRLAGDLSGTYRRTSVRVLANVVKATHGESRAEIVGSGDHRQPFQSFVLRQLPLTYVSSGTAGGARSTLAIWVSGVRWTEVPTLYGQTAAARVFVTRRSDRGEVAVAFGDGITGARLPSGTDNVVATYRVGIGTAAVLPAGRISIPLARPMGLLNVVNPVPAEGADDPESLELARSNAPVAVRTLGRVVSVADYEDAARSFVGVGKVRADVIWDGERSVVHLTLAGPCGAAIGPTSPTLVDLRAALDEMRHAVVPVEIAGYVARPFAVDARVLCAADRLPADVIAVTRAALIERYSFSRQEFARSVPVSEVVAVMQGVPGVVAVVLQALHPTGEDEDIIDPLPAFPARRVGNATHPAELVVVDPDAIHLTEVG